MNCNSVFFKYLKLVLEFCKKYQKTLYKNWNKLNIKVNFLVWQFKLIRMSFVCNYFSYFEEAEACKRIMNLKFGGIS